MSLADAGAPVKPEAPRPETPDAATAARVAQLLGLGFSREDAERGAARCSTADEAVIWLVEERARVDDCRAVDAARERSEADADAAKARRAALAKVDEEELAFGVGENAYRKRAALLTLRTPRPSPSSARRRSGRCSSTTRSRARAASSCDCCDEDALRLEADRFSDALFKFSGGGVPAFFLGNAAAEPDDGEVELRPAPPRDAADVIDVT
ncbi:BT1-like protein [Aureococcus anophagefferens]|nr:BT1-like protein [Aureococcus anophagefferens]